MRAKGSLLRRGELSQSDGTATGRPEAAGLPSTGPLALWLALQLGVTLLAVLRVPLAAQYPEPAEALAAHLIFGAQVVAPAVLFPFLLRDLRAAAQAIVAAWPFQLAAGYLAGMSPQALVWPAAFVSAWLATLAIYAALLRTRRLQALGITLAALLTVGLATLRYLRVEFGMGTGAVPHALENASPLLSTFHALDGFNAWPAWLLLAVLLAAAAGSFLPRQLTRTRSTAQSPS